MDHFLSIVWQVEFHVKELGLNLSKLPSKQLLTTRPLPYKFDFNKQSLLCPRKAQPPLLRRLPLPKAAPFGRACLLIITAPSTSCSVTSPACPVGSVPLSKNGLSWMGQCGRSA